MPPYGYLVISSLPSAINPRKFTVPILPMIDYRNIYAYITRKGVVRKSYVYRCQLILNGELQRVFLYPN